MAGYCGCRMSNNAIDAYKHGQKPISNWKKGEILDQIKEMVDNGELLLNCSFTVLEKTPVEVLKKVCLYKSSWHHTGKYYRVTSFYSLDTAAIENLTDERLQGEASDYRKQKKELKQEKENETEELWRCTYLKWSKDRNCPKAREVTVVGIIKGCWFYPLHGGKKRKISAKGFTKIKRITESDTKVNT